MGGSTARVEVIPDLSNSRSGRGLETLPGFSTTNFLYLRTCFCATFSYRSSCRRFATIDLRFLRALGINSEAETSRRSATGLNGALRPG